ncbi:hypothetical protein Efla_001360 [Eimeria flavescens]
MCISATDMRADKSTVLSPGPCGQHFAIMDEAEEVKTPSREATAKGPRLPQPSEGPPEQRLLQSFARPASSPISTEVPSMPAAIDHVASADASASSAQADSVEPIEGRPPERPSEGHLPEEQANNSSQDGVSSTGSTAAFTSAAGEEQPRADASSGAAGDDGAAAAAAAAGEAASMDQEDEAEMESEEDTEAVGGSSKTENLLIPRLQGRQAWRPRGQRRSFGRLCKGKAAAGGCAGDGSSSAAAAAKRKWQQQQQQKQQQQQAREAEKQARAVKEAVRVQRRQQREAKRQRKKENELKSSKVQVVRDTTKIRKWNKQARRQLVKMSPEMIRQLYGVQL